MRFPFLALMLCVTVLGRAGAEDATGLIAAPGTAAKAELQSRLDGTAPGACFSANQLLNPPPDVSASCPKRIWFDAKSLEKLAAPFGSEQGRRAPGTQLMGQIDPKIVIRVPQSAIGTLPPARSVLPLIYPELKMLLIHGDAQSANPLQQQEGQKPQFTR